MAAKQEKLSNAIPASDPEAVTAHIQKLDPLFAEMVEKLRQTILTTDPEIGEHIKWNSPAFFFKGEMKPFDPKEYKRDLLVMNLRKGHILLVFPTGAIINDSSGFLEGTYTDGRRMATFHTMSDVGAKEKMLQQVIRQWLDLVDK